jgi:hypothetical protein
VVGSKLIDLMQYRKVENNVYLIVTFRRGDIYYSIDYAD